jgi:hypothetical protein
MLAHLLGVLGLIAAALILILGLGVTVFALAHGDRALARRTGLASRPSPPHLAGCDLRARRAEPVLPSDRSSSARSTVTASRSSP